MLQSWATDITTDFHNDEYRSKITKIRFVLTDKVPENRVEAWDVSNTKDKSVMAWVEDNANEGYILTIAGREKIVANNNSRYLFYNFIKLKEIENSNILDTKNVSNMGEMFRDCRSLENLDLSSFNTSNVTRMNGMFMECSNLTSLNLSNFDTSKVTIINQMFQSCSNLINLDISSFNTSKVNSFQAFFENCNALKSLKLGSDFTFANVNDIQNMFNNCNNLTVTINMDRKKTAHPLFVGAFLDNAATIHPAKIMINYTAENEHMVDGWIKGKGDSNIVKGNLI